MNLSESTREFILASIESGILLGSLGVVSFANVAHSAFSPGSVFTRISLSYLVSNADFVAAAQLLVYVGAINVSIVSAVMITDESPRSNSTSRGVGYFIALGACAILLSALTDMIHNTEWFDTIINFTNQSEISATGKFGNNVQQIGYKLLSEFPIPFELVSLLLSVALVGAINPARDEDEVAIDEKSSLSRDKSSFFQLI
uniref:NADH-plastoquinone oxidoreductase subunit 6 n=1 Tax=Microlepia speluncae TaxID=449865 RepID=UPI001FA7889C|nr:NADH-plastoquinone oxidoreductase subunit 6 [Microlepia speluncae]ULU28010.1 NADH-plastoquinone oxidoreductase subunit 6 [Microlepia speluncae]